ncbi:MAG: MBL fold metallo-hydrolase, partial [Anaerolineales bacterium]|nr:MBL fold metallo-hydrolase [Anaerolineales bacterium]
MENQDLEILTLTQGPAMTNAYLAGDAATGTAVVIDPAWDGGAIYREAEERGWRITSIWLTHAHFDHFGGAAELYELSPTPLAVGLHPQDHPLWRVSGEASFFGVESFDPGPEPTVELEHGMELHLGEHHFEVRHTPGHSPGHVNLNCLQAGVVFCGDLVFAGSVGRTDVPG